MIQLSIVFKNSSVTLPLNFKHFKKAGEVRQMLKEFKGGEVEDDYGTIASIKDSADISSIVLIDLAKEIDRQYEFQVMQQSAAKKVQAVGSKLIQPVNTLANSLN